MKLVETTVIFTELACLANECTEVSYIHIMGFYLAPRMKVVRCAFLEVIYGLLESFLSSYARINILSKHEVTINLRNNVKIFTKH